LGENICTVQNAYDNNIYKLINQLYLQSALVCKKKYLHDSADNLEKVAQPNKRVIRKQK
jgi:hypothetical protein